MASSEAPVADPTDEQDAIVLAAVDTSNSASRVIDTASRLARRNWARAQLHIAHIVRHGMLDRAPPGGVKDTRLEDDARAYLDHHVRMARRLSTVPVTGHFAEGNPADEIVRLAKSLSVDLVVVGTHDTAGFGRLLVGSVSEAVARKAGCSVLVVRPKRSRHPDDEELHKP